MEEEVVEGAGTEGAVVEVLAAAAMSMVCAEFAKERRRDLRGMLAAIPELRTLEADLMDRIEDGR